MATRVGLLVGLPFIESRIEQSEGPVLCVQDYTSANGVLREPPGVHALRGKLLVQLGSGSPREGRETAAWARSNDIHYLDGAIMATPNFIGKAAAVLVTVAPLWAEGFGLLLQRYRRGRPGERDAERAVVVAPTVERSGA
jgi:hypothetical protein